MRKIIASINMTVDGFCDHTAMNPDADIHRHYTELLSSADAIFYGRITYQLMESYWPALVKAPTGNKPYDEFAVAMDNISKIVFSRTLENVSWKNSILKKEINKEEILELKGRAGRDILVGSPGTIVSFTKLGLVDEYQLCVHPVILGKGLQLFKNITDRIDLKFLRSKAFASGPIVLYYEPVKND